MIPARISARASGEKPRLARAPGRYDQNGREIAEAIIDFEKETP
jgi:hypothetical protein